SSQREYLIPDQSSQVGLQAERRVSENGAVLGPIYEFAGIGAQGYLSYSPVGQTSVRIDYPTAVAPVAVASLAGNASYLGNPAYKVTLATAALGEANRYVAYEGELLINTNTVLAGFRILSHTDSELLLDPTSGALPTNATKFRVRAKFLKVITNGTEGLGTVVAGPNPTPVANLRIGFAFHNDPQAGLSGRFPPNEQDFLRDLDDPTFLNWIAQQSAAANGRNRHPRYVQWDVIFDLGFAGQPLRPTTPRPELHFLRLPFRF
ncbi:MAG TPA: hypothetical protein VFD82_22380, partial [Planctomycetota bacterium]|nr:hypothetical protein [Planctomycetota bacterium]